MAILSGNPAKYWLQSVVCAVWKCVRTCTALSGPTASRLDARLPHIVHFYGFHLLNWRGPWAPRYHSCMYLHAWLLTWQVVYYCKLRIAIQRHQMLRDWRGLAHVTSHLNNFSQLRRTFFDLELMVAKWPRIRRNVIYVAPFHNRSTHV